MEYRFWGWRRADVLAVTDQYKGIRMPTDLYDALDKMQFPRTKISKWTAEDSFFNGMFIAKEMGQCYN